MHRPSISHTDLQSHTQTFNLTQNIHSLVYLTYTVWEVPQEQSPHEAHTYINHNIQIWQAWKNADRVPNSPQRFTVILQHWLNITEVAVFWLLQSPAYSQTLVACVWMECKVDNTYVEQSRNIKPHAALTRVRMHKYVVCMHPLQTWCRPFVHTAFSRSSPRPTNILQTGLIKSHHSHPMPFQW